MPQIAQQDYIRIPINDISALTETERAEFRKCAENSTILDVIIEDKDGAQYRVLTNDYVSGGTLVVANRQGELMNLDIEG